MENKITRRIRTTTIYYKIYGDEDNDFEIITLPGILSDDRVWKTVKKLGG